MDKVEAVPSLRQPDANICRCVCLGVETAFGVLADLGVQAPAASEFYGSHSLLSLKLGLMYVLAT